MTVRINFLPRNYQPPKQLGMKEWGIAAAVALAVVATGAYYGSVYAGTVDMENQTQVSQTKLQNVRTLLADADQIKAREARVAKAENDLKVLAGRHWSGVLLTLSQLTPQHVTWTSLNSDGTNITLKGTSRGLVDIAQLLGGLTNETSVQEVNLKVVNEKGVPITVTVKAPDQGTGAQSTGTQSGQNGAAQSAATQNAQAALATATKELGTVKQLEFELTIILKPAEGREMPHGA